MQWQSRLGGESRRGEGRIAESRTAGSRTIDSREAESRVADRRAQRVKKKRGQKGELRVRVSDVPQMIGPSAMREDRLQFT